LDTTTFLLPRMAMAMDPEGWTAWRGR